MGHDTAAVALLTAGWSTGSAPTTAAMPFPSLPRFHPALSACVGWTGGREQVPAKGQILPGTGRALAPRFSCHSRSVGPLPLPVITHLCKMCRVQGVGGMSGAQRAASGTHDLESGHSQAEAATLPQIHLVFRHLTALYFSGN